MFADHSVNVSPNAGENGSTLLPAGSMINYAGNTAPAGWLICDGTAYSRIVYATLFKAIGTTYGVGDGTTTFNVPNTAGKTIRGVNGTYLIGQTGGADAHTLAANELPDHKHGVYYGGGTALASGSGQRCGDPNVDIGVKTFGIYDTAGNTLGTQQAVSIINTYVAVPFIIKAF